MSAKVVADQLAKTLEGIWQCQVTGDQFKAEASLFASGAQLALVLVDATSPLSNAVTNVADYYQDPKNMSVVAYLLTVDGGKSIASTRLVGFLEWALIASGASWTLSGVPSLSNRSPAQVLLHYRADLQRLV